MTVTVTENRMNVRVEQERYVVDILSVGLAVHMTAVGSYHRTDKEQTHDLAILRHRLLYWEPNTKNSKTLEFDNAVRAVILAAVKEAERVDRS